MDGVGQDVVEPRRHRWLKLLLIIGAPWALLVLSVIFIRSEIIEPYNAPNGSMAPTLQVGDHFFVMKTIDRQAITRGDVVVFHVPAKGADYVKRVVGTAGDTVQMKVGRLYINGTVVTREPAGDFVDPRGATLARHRELLPDGGVHDILELSDGEMLGDTQIFTVPPGHVFVLGDNRDNSLDSRTPPERGGLGFVPMENVIGRVTYIFWSKDWSRIGTRVE